jgi:hypothetical protein
MDIKRAAAEGLTLERPTGCCGFKFPQRNEVG